MSKADTHSTETPVEDTEAVSTDTTRRNFLIGAGLGGIGAAAAWVGAEAIKPDAPAPEATAEAEGQGYRETEHIRRYYGTTRL